MRIKLLMIFLYLFIFLILEINNQCDKENPIRKNNNCQHIYCSEIEFQNGDCIIDNPIIKTQWLNKLIYLGDNIINMLTIIEMPNNNIYFLSSKWEANTDYFYIYRLESSGEINYNENNNNFKKILISSFKVRGYIELNEINAVGLIIDNQEYIFVCQFLYTECQLIEFENNKIFNEYLTEILDIDQYSYYHLARYFSISLMTSSEVYFFASLMQSTFIALISVGFSIAYTSFLYSSSSLLKCKEEER